MQTPNDIVRAHLGDVAYPTKELPEKCLLNMPMNDSTDNVVALENKSTTAVVGSHLLIDGEEMTVTDAADPSNLIVERGGILAAHEVGAEVLIYGG